MKIKTFVAAFFSAVFSLQSAFAQTYCMPASSTQTITTLTGSFYDSGCAANNYSDNENGVIVFCPGSLCYTTLNFTLIALADPGDTIRIYSGTMGPLIATYHGTLYSTFPFTITSSDLVSGCLSVQFISNSSGTAAGWAAAIGCSGPTSASEIQTIFSAFLSTDFSENHLLYLNIASQQSFTLNIFTADGKKISGKNYSLAAGQHQISLPTQNLPQGIYFCRVMGEGVNRVFKFIKSK